jgi:DNA-binding beta-propeller fold protein YncE
LTCCGFVPKLLRIRRYLLPVVALCGTVLLSAPAASAPRHRLQLPYDVEARDGFLYIADAGRHQLLRYNLARRKLTVLAGTGRAGRSGDGGPARRARLAEPTELVLDRAGNVYFSDVFDGRVRRIDRRGVITTVARVPATAGLSVDPESRFLAIGSIEGYVYRMPLPAGPLERLAGDGTPASSGDGGPAGKAQVDEPHDVTYDPAGNLLIMERAGVRRIDAATGTINTVFPGCVCKVVPGARGTLYLMSGDPNGGKITQVDSSGTVLRVIGTGGLSRHKDRVAIDRIGFLPTDVEPVGGAILITQGQPIAAVRRLANGSRTLTTLLR